MRIRVFEKMREKKEEKRMKKNELKSQKFKFLILSSLYNTDYYK